MLTQQFIEKLAEQFAKKFSNVLDSDAQYEKAANDFLRQYVTLAVDSEEHTDLRSDFDYYVERNK